MTKQHGLAWSFVPDTCQSTRVLPDALRLDVSTDLNANTDESYAYVYMLLRLRI